MNRKLVINFLEKLKSSNNIPVDLFENSGEYTPGELLDFLVELEKTKVADFRNGIIRVTSEKQKIREFKAKNISFTKSLGTGAVKFSASKIGEDLFLLLDYIYKHPAMSKEELSEVLGIKDLIYPLDQLRKMSFITLFEGEYYCVLIPEEYEYLLNELKARGVKIELSKGSEITDVLCEVTVNGTAIKGTVTSSLTPLGILTNLYMACSDVNLKRALRSSGVHLLVYASVVDYGKSSFTWVLNGKSAKLELNKPLNLQVDTSKHKEFTFTAEIILKSAT